MCRTGFKEQPMFPETYQALKWIHGVETKKGPLFLNFNGKIFEYRQIQRAYDLAFSRANLPFTGTHIMRHGGCRALLNETGDRYIAQQHLGNSSFSSTDIYAKRDAKALTEAVQKRWEILEGGRIWSHDVCDQ